MHAEYELKALIYYWNAIKLNRTPIIVGDKNIDLIWIEREVIPKWVFNSFIVTCCAFIEDQVVALIAENPDLENLCRNNFGKCLTELFIKYGKRDLLDNRPFLLDEIRFMRRIRNKIVHQGGKINEDVTNLRYQIQERKGLGLEPSGHIVVSEHYCDHALATVQRFVRYITQFKTKY